MVIFGKWFSLYTYNDVLLSGCQNQLAVAKLLSLLLFKLSSVVISLSNCWDAGMFGVTMCQVLDQHNCTLMPIV